jgi:hypothetical protein
MDHVGARLESRAQPLCHRLRKPAAGRIVCEIEKMKVPGKNPGYGNGGKTNRVFPPFPQPLLLGINLDKKRPTLNNRRSFTQNN